VRVDKTDEGADLAGEAADDGAGEHLGAGGLEDDVAVEVAVVGEIDQPHAAGAELGANLVPAAGELQTFPGGGIGHPAVSVAVIPGRQDRGYSTGLPVLDGRSF